jgi:hypothetical protein
MKVPSPLALLLLLACTPSMPEPTFGARDLADFAESNDAAAEEVWLIKRSQPEDGCLGEHELRACHRCRDEPLCWGIVLQGTQQWAREVRPADKRHRYPWLLLHYCE